MGLLCMLMYEASRLRRKTSTDVNLWFLLLRLPVHMYLLTIIWRDGTYVTLHKDNLETFVCSCQKLDLRSPRKYYIVPQRRLNQIKLITYLNPEESR